MPAIPQGQIRIDSVSAAHINFERVWVPGTAPNQLPIELDFNFSTTPLDTRSILVQATMSVWRDQPSVPFRVSISYELRASVEAESDSELLNEFGKANALGVLVPYLREALSSITARSSFAPLVLPPVNAQTLLEMTRARAGNKPK